MFKIALNAGHGINTSGKQTPDGIKEWTLNDDVCDRIQAILSDYECEVIRTDHNEGEIDEPISQRVKEYLKAGVEVLVSIHHNAYTSNWNEATGVEVYTDRTPIATVQFRNASDNAMNNWISSYSGTDRGQIWRKTTMLDLSSTEYANNYFNNNDTW